MATVKKKKSGLSQVAKQFRKNKMAMFGLVAIVLLILLAIFTPFITPYNPTYMDYPAINTTLGRARWFGCDNLGRDILSCILYGARYPLSLDLITALIGCFVGLFFGIWTGCTGGEADMTWIRVMDIWPTTSDQLLTIVISTALGAGLVDAIIAMSIGGIPGGIRSSRAMCLKGREMEYLEAARSINCSKFKIMYIHVLSNIVAPTIVGTAMSIGTAIMGATGLSFVGLGIQPPSPEWGAMLSAKRGFILQYPHILIFPGFALAIIVLMINLFGDSLRDAIDPEN